MIWAAFLSSGLGWLFYRGMYVDPARDAALWCWMIAVLLVTTSYVRSNVGRGWRMRRWRNAAPELFLLPIICGSSQWLFLVLYERIAMLGPSADALGPAAATAVGLLGFDSFAAEGTVYVQNEVATLDVSLTPETLALPLLGCILIPGVVLAVPRILDDPRVAIPWLAKAFATTIVYAIVRFALALALFMDYGDIGVFWHPIWLGLEGALLVVLLSRTAPLRPFLDRIRAFSSRELAFAIAALVVATTLTSLHAFRFRLENSGPTTVLVDDAHSDWAWTDVPFGKADFTRRATYSYTNFVEYLAYHFSVDVNSAERLDTLPLSSYDVLVLKTPTEPYAESEIEAIASFVDEGGGLFLIGDHTNLFGMTTHMNSLSKRFGVLFEMDATYDLDTGNTSRFHSSIFNPHPIARHISEFEFETSCTVRGPLAAEYVMSGRGLASEMVDYSHVNFFGDMQFDLRDRFGTFAQGVAVRYGAGRVFAFGDSTVLSNFSLYKAGRAEFVLATVDYLAHGGGIPWYVTWLIVPSLFGIAIAALTKCGLVQPSLRVLLAATAGGIALALPVVAMVNERTFPLPDAVEEYPTVIFDQRFSQFELPSMIGAQGRSLEYSFDAFFVATQRLGLVPRLRRDFEAALLDAEVLVLINPVGVVYEREALAVERFVVAGGQMLVMLDGRGPFFAANALLSRVGVSMAPTPPDASVDAPLDVGVHGLEMVDLPNRFDDVGDDFPVLYSGRFGDGRMALVIGGQFFSQEWMGPAFNSPDADQKHLYDLEYFVFEELLQR